MNVHKGISLREALRVAEQLGCTVEWMGGTGEVRVSPPAACANVQRVVANGRRKDCPRKLVTLLRQVAAATSATV